MARLLQRAERTDEVADALLVLLVASAELADLVSSDDPANDTPVYARAKVLAGHASMLGQLAALVGPVVSEDSFERFMADLATPTPGSGTQAW
jgi:hypothetical protein